MVLNSTRCSRWTGGQDTQWQRKQMWRRSRDLLIVCVTDWWFGLFWFLFLNSHWAIDVSRVLTVHVLSTSRMFLILFAPSLIDQVWVRTRAARGECRESSQPTLALLSWPEQVDGWVILVSVFLFLTGYSHSRWWDESCLCISETLLDCS